MVQRRERKREREKKKKLPQWFCFPCKLSINNDDYYHSDQDDQVAKRLVHLLQYFKNFVKIDLIRNASIRIRGLEQSSVLFSNSMKELLLIFLHVLNKHSNLLDCLPLILNLKGHPLFEHYISLLKLVFQLHRLWSCLLSGIFQISVNLFEDGGYLNHHSNHFSLHMDQLK